MTTASATQENRSMRPFLTIWIGQVFSMLGSELVQFALIWYLTVETKSATVLATLMAFQMLPMVFVGPFAGALVDRWNRRVTMIVADGVVALATAALAILFATGLIETWHIYVILLIRSTGKVFHGPAMTATTPLMVPKEHLTRVAGLNQTLQGVMMLFAPPLGALLFTLLPIQGVLAIDIVTALIAILPLMFVFVPQPERSAESKANNVLQDMVAGFRYTWNWTGLMVILAMACLINMLLNPAFALLPLYVSDYFGKGALELGWTQSAFGIGIIAGGLLLSVWGGFKKRIVTAMVALTGLGLTTIGMGLLPPSLFVGLIAISLSQGIVQVLCNGSIGAVMQGSIRPDMQGRVFTLIGSLATALSPIGLLLGGRVAETFGLPTMYIVGGAVCAAMGVIGLLLRSVREIEEDAKTLNPPVKVIEQPRVSEPEPITERAVTLMVNSNE